MPLVKLQSSDGVIFKTEVEVAKRCGTIKYLLEECGIDEGQGSDAIIPISNVEAAVLGKVLLWAKYHVNDPRENFGDQEPHISGWDAKFLDIDQGMLLEIIRAADYLDIKKLMDIACQAVRNRIKGSTTESISKLFNFDYEK